jgi:hypothetical protein
MKTALIIAAAALITGCSTIPEHTYTVSGKTYYIRCRSADKIRTDRRLQSAAKFPSQTVLATCEEVGCHVFINVPWSGEIDINGKPLPDFEMLGHEIWHTTGLGGNFHK